MAWASKTSAALAGGDDAGPEIQPWRIAASFLLCILISFAIVAIKKHRIVQWGRWRGIDTQKRMKLVESLRLPGNIALHYVEVDGKPMLLTQDANGSTVTAISSSTEKGGSSNN
ncbi:hypothetical protein [Burkholderia ubonensis]|uniref:hypothetical protein n=1 Tax=Burkholderia ubonensis TaxID=101571 RepID=UPI0012BB10D8|nr:hypothetical protein [Burkholderia ubonensis]